MIPQGTGGVSGPGTASQGSSVTVSVSSGDASVTVSTSGAGSTTVPVPPGGVVKLPVPNVPPGTVLVVSVGKGNRKSIHLVEVIPPAP